MLISYLIPMITITITIVLLVIKIKPINERLWFWPLRVIVVIVISIIILYLPLYKGCTIGQILYGVLGNISITTLLIFGITLFYQVFLPKQKFRLNLIFAIIVIIIGSLLYLSTLGFINFDIYALGYFPNGVMLLTVILLELFLLDYAQVYAWIWLIALISFYFRIESSNNLWDYLLDPLLWIFSIFNLIRSVLAR